MATISSLFSTGFLSNDPLKADSSVAVQSVDANTPPNAEVSPASDSAAEAQAAPVSSTVDATITPEIPSQPETTVAPVSEASNVSLAQQVEPKEAATTAVVITPQEVVPPKAENITMEPVDLAKINEGLEVTPPNVVVAQPDDTIAKSKIIRASTQVRGASKLKKMLDETDDLIVCPGVYDGVSARVALSMGFDAMYMTGAGTTASRLGMADLGIAQLHDMREHAEMIANLEPYGPPLIADMDTGYGGPIMVANSVSQYIRAGVAGFHIEDQIQNKRCGHLQGKKVVPAEEFYMRIRAAKGAKDRLQSDIVLIARTDANQQHGYEECIRRLKGARDLGADVGLLEGFTSREEAERAVQELAPWPLLLNMVENGATPIITTTEAKKMGFRIMIFSFASLAPAVVAIRKTFQRILTDGVVGTGKELTPKALFEICGLKDSMTIDFEAGGAAFQQI